MKTLSLVLISILFVSCAKDKETQSAPAQDSSDEAADAAPAEQPSASNQDDVITPGIMGTVAECTAVDLPTAPWARLIFLADFQTKAQLLMEYKPEDIGGSGSVFPYFLGTNFTFALGTAGPNGSWIVDGSFGEAGHAVRVRSEMLANLDGKQAVGIEIWGEGESESSTVSYSCIVH